MNGEKAALGVVVDGVAMGEDEARALWERFSAHMEANKGDLAGFAAKEGFASVHPSMQNGRAVLVASRTAPQQAYKSVDRAGGSSDHHGSRARPLPARGKRGGSRG